MKTRKRNSENSILCLLAIGLALAAGCRDEEQFSRYPSLEVPEYAKTDYIRDLTDPNPELVYNAICNLGKNAAGFSKTLCADDADIASDNYKQAEAVYDAIRGTLDSKNPQVVAASLRFLQLFAKNYKAKGELLEAAVKVQGNHPLVQFEQVELLKRVIDENSRLPQPLLLRLLESPSWIVTRSTYELIGQLPEEPLRLELVRLVQTTHDKKEQLILVCALGGQPLQQEEARMFEEQMLAAVDPEIRLLIGKLLACNADTPEARAWFNTHHTQFSSEELKGMFEICSDVELQCQFIKLGYIPSDHRLKSWAEDLTGDRQTDDMAELRQLDQALQNSPRLSGHWQELKDQVEQKRQQTAALRKDMTPLSREFVETAKTILAQNNLPEDIQEKKLKNLENALKALTKN